MADLVERARGGDQSAWSEIVDRFAGLVWAVVRGYALDPADALDAAQTTWLRLVEHLDRIREPEHLGAWLATTARRESLRLIELRKRECPTEELEEIDALEPEPLDGLMQAERKEALGRAVTSLSSRRTGRRAAPLQRRGAELRPDLCETQDACGSDRPHPQALPRSAQRYPLVRQLQG